MVEEQLAETLLSFSYVVPTVYRSASLATPLPAGKLVVHMNMCHVASACTAYMPAVYVSITQAKRG